MKTPASNSHPASPLRRGTITAFLIILCCGYCAALVNMYLTYGGLDGQPGMTMNDVITYFHGNKMATKLVMMINGKMRKNLANDEQKQQLEQWVADGATRDGYEKVEDIFKTRCIRCHDMFGEAEFAPLTSFDAVSKFTKPYEGVSWRFIARLSHQHLFGIGFIFFLSAYCITRNRLRLRLKNALALIAFMSLLVDVGGWWLTKLAPLCAIMVMAGGAVSSMAFAAMIVLGLYEMWWERVESPML